MDRARTSFFTGLIVALTIALAVALTGCDSGEKVVDEVTGNRAVKQYHQSKKDLSDIAEQQEKRYGGIPDEEKNPDEQNR